MINSIPNIPTIPNPRWTSMVRFPVERANYIWISAKAGAEGKPLGEVLNEVLERARAADTQHP